MQNFEEGHTKKNTIEKLCALDKIKALVAGAASANRSQGSLCCFSITLALGQKKASLTVSKLIFFYLQSDLTVTVNFLNVT